MQVRYFNRCFIEINGIIMHAHIPFDTLGHIRIHKMTALLFPRVKTKGMSLSHYDYPTLILASG